MTQTLKAFDEKIEDLKKKKSELETKQSKQLFKYLSQEIGQEFSPQLVGCIIKESWKQSNQKQREAWFNSAEKFQLSHPRKNRKTTAQNSTKHQSIRAEEV